MEHTKAYWRRPLAVVAAGTAAVLAVLLVGGSAGAAIVPAVPLATLTNYSVLGASTVTNTGPSVLASSVGLSPGTSVTGFPPGLVLPPGIIDVNSAAAAQAQSDLTNAYVDAAGRPIDATTTADLGNQTLLGGVYATSGKGALGLTGPLVLDGAGDPNSVFIFQTDSTLTTASSSTVSLINGALGCNVFWQVGSSATLGTSSTFVGNILAQASVTVTTGVTVQGRAFARTGAVTLDTDTFVDPSCAVIPPTTTSTSTTTAGTGSSSVPLTTTTTPTTLGNPSTPGSTPSTLGAPGTPTSDDTGTTGQANDTSTLAATGVPIGALFVAGALMLIVGLVALRYSHNAP